MPFWLDVHILPSGKTHQFSTASDTFYVFEEGYITRTHKALVWCRHCKDVTEGEHIESLEELDALIEAYGNPESDVCRGYKERDGTAEVDMEKMRHLQANAIHRRRWRSLRVSPPKCLQCGKTDIQPLPWQREIEIDGHNIYQSCTTHWSGDWLNRYLSVEGEWLGGEEYEERPAKKWWQF